LILRLTQIITPLAVRKSCLDINTIWRQLFAKIKQKKLQVVVTIIHNSPKTQVSLKAFTTHGTVSACSVALQFIGHFSNNCKLCLVRSGHMQTLFTLLLMVFQMF
jgi:hypothetical protein